MALTKKNYFSQSNNLKYMGSSQFKSFMKCEAAALAEINGEWERPMSTALLVGSYVDSYFEGTLDEFKAEHPEIFNSRTGELKSDYKQADIIIKIIEADPLMMKYMSGKKQVIKTGLIAGVPFKIKMDVYHKGKAIVDGKVMADFAPKYSPRHGRVVNFAEFWGYDIQAAIYQEIEKQHSKSDEKLPFFLVGATKQDIPDKAVIRVTQSLIDEQLELVKAYAPRFNDIKKGIIPPTRCESCAYCRATKKLDRVQDLIEFDEDIGL
jgi:hypothetical protein